MGGGAGRLFRRTRNGARHCEAPPCAKNRPRAQPRAKNNRPKARAPSSSSGKRPQKRVGYSLGGWGWPTSSAGLGMARDFERCLRVPKIGRGLSSAINNRLNAGAPSSSSGKRPQKRVGYSLGGWGWPTSSAGLGMARDFARRFHGPKLGRGLSRAQK